MSRKNLNLALATGSLIAGATAHSQATVVKTELSTPLTISSDTDSIYFSPIAGTASTSDFSGDQFQLSFDTSNSKPQATALNTGIGEEGIGFPFDIIFAEDGSEVGSSDTFITSGDILVPSEDGSHHFMGLALADASAQTDYGYAEFSGNVNGSFTLYGFAYEDDGLSILVPSVPEPSTTALMLLSAGSLAAYAARRRRQAAARA